MTRTAILWIGLAAGAVLLAALFWIAGQPRSTRQPAPATAAATAAATSTPAAILPVTKDPATAAEIAAGKAVINCHITAGSAYTPTQYTAHAGRVYVQIVIPGQCSGWIEDSSP